MLHLSPLRARLASFEHGYAVATQLRRQTGRNQFVVLTGNPLQPVRVTASLAPCGEQLLALVL